MQFPGKAVSLMRSTWPPRKAASGPGKNKRGSSLASTSMERSGSLYNKLFKLGHVPKLDPMLRNSTRKWSNSIWTRTRYLSLILSPIWIFKIWGLKLSYPAWSISKKRECLLTWVKDTSIRKLGSSNRLLLKAWCRHSLLTKQRGKTRWSKLRSKETSSNLRFSNQMTSTGNPLRASLSSKTAGWWSQWKTRAAWGLLDRDLKDRSNPRIPPPWGKDTWTAMTPWGCWSLMSTTKLEPSRSPRKSWATLGKSEGPQRSLQIKWWDLRVVFMLFLKTSIKMELVIRWTSHLIWIMCCAKIHQRMTNHTLQTMKACFRNDYSRKWTPCQSLSHQV